MNASARVMFPVAVDAQALRDHLTDRDRLIHHAVTSVLRNHGVLTLGDGDANALFGAMENLGSDSQVLWGQLLKALEKWGRIDPTSRTSSVADVLSRIDSLDDYGSVVRLIVAGESNARRLGVDASSTCRTISGSDVVVAASVDKSTAVIHAAGLGKFPPNTRRSEVSDTLVRPLAARSTCVRVMDPQMLERYLNDEKRRPCHVEWLLQALATAMPPQSTISLIGTLQNDWVWSGRASQERRIQGLIEETLADRTEPLTVRVTLVQSSRTPLQNRFIWFSCGHSYDVLHNFEPLRENVLKRELRFVRQKDDDAYDTMVLAEAYEAASQRGMLSVTVQLPISTEGIVEC